MKINKIKVVLDSIDLKIIGVTDYREFLIWRCWLGTDTTLIPKIKEICQNNSNAIKHINDDNKDVREFAQIKLLELYQHTIELGDGF